ncbi:N-6 DNA methylase [Streptomyces sp. NPDC059637]|uniref:N-6 DNA methylase n=1 Tax=Streptomyces sp. NPDC059637 TaxID=3347752 RepID=UPI0036D1B7DF
MPQTVTVSAAEISRLAGVGRAAVSNWRRRHPDFPAPAGGTDASPLFALGEVEEWLRAQGKLAGTCQRDWLWPYFDVLGDRDRSGRAIAAAGAACLAKQGGGPPVLPDAPADPADRELVDRAVAVAEADDEGPRGTFEFLRGRWLDTHVRQISSTPPELAELMIDLALAGTHDDDRAGGPAGEGAADTPFTVLDPACGTGTLLAAALRALPAGGRGPLLLGQEADPTLAVLAAVRLAFASRARDGGTPPPDIRTGDTLRHDAHPDTPADAVVCNPPFNERNWGHDELAWDDPRWTYGTPPRTEPELAWVLHCLARLRPGAPAVLLMPPAVASRRAGRRIRAALLQRGALRAVVALPPGAAPPHGVALHLWVLTRPQEDETPPDSVLLVDTAAPPEPDGSRPDWDWAGVRRATTDAWAAFRRGGAETADRPGLCRAVRVVDLLDDEVDLTPARHVPRDTAGTLVHGLDERWDELDGGLRELAGLTAALRGLRTPGAAASGSPRPQTTVGDLLRAGHLTLRTGSAAHQPLVRDGEPPSGAVRALALTDMAPDAQPSGWVPAGEVSPDWAVTRPGDVVVATAAHSAAVLVAGEEPMVLGPRLDLLRPDPEVIDPWFLAGCLRSAANARQAGTHASTTSRIDVRRMQVPRLPQAEQARHGEVFRRLEALEAVLLRTGATGRGLVRSLTDALASGTVEPS